MTITLIILAYVANVFLNRWLNFKLYKIDKEFHPLPIVWFFATLGTVVLVFFILTEKDYFIAKGNWFTGKNW